MAEHRAVNVLIDALVNIRREVQFFGDVAEEYGLDLEALPVRSSCRGSEDDEGGGVYLFMTCLILVSRDLVPFSV